MIFVILIILIVVTLLISFLLSANFEVRSINDEIVSFLPNHDCNKCGYETCYHFSDIIISDINNVTKCPYMNEEKQNEIIALMRKKKKG